MGIKFLIDGNMPSAGGKSCRFGSVRPARNLRRPWSLRPGNKRLKRERKKQLKIEGGDSENERRSVTAPSLARHPEKWHSLCVSAAACFKAVHDSVCV